MPITREEVTDAALAVLRRDGLDALSLRTVAEHLGVRHNTVRWHVSTKAQLLELLSDRVLAGWDAGRLPEPPMERVRALYGIARRALLGHRDGARLVSGVFTTGPHTLSFTEAVLSALVEAGRSPRQAMWTHWSVFYFLLGLTTEQQAGTADRAATLEQALRDQHLPTLAQAAPSLLEPDFDERFAHGLEALLGKG
ncbi:TetR/AcrR family transcriptional regulator C-terminal domain-containing protein [Streptomyces rubradiris]|uniref:TetR/AcrR family transcriptional regulator C-terminal domain-containing protein n=1 Tax=Streptomyces rubradiris TaxID=285531 RepID=UPI0036EA321A